jgi:hypothetical protein
MNCGHKKNTKRKKVAVYPPVFGMQNPVAGIPTTGKPYPKDIISVNAIFLFIISFPPHT